MRILLTNDDGFHAPGLARFRRALSELGDVDVVAPEVEQSGKSHSITYREPLFVREVGEDHEHSGWIVGGTPADCVKLAITQLCDPRPDLVVSGINHGLNGGLNVLYSGTVAAAVEGAFFAVPSLAISLEANTTPDWNAATSIAVQLITGLLDRDAWKTAPLFNINIPTAATTGNREAKLVPMGCRPYGEQFVRRLAPTGRAYYWATGDPPPESTEYYSDLSALNDGFIAITPLTFDLSHYNALEALSGWRVELR